MLRLHVDTPVKLFGLAGYSEPDYVIPILIFNFLLRRVQGGKSGSQGLESISRIY